MSPVEEICYLPSVADWRAELEVCLPTLLDLSEQIQLDQLLQGQASVVVGLGMSGALSKDQFEVADRIGILPLSQEDVPEIVMGISPRTHVPIRYSVFGMQHPGRIFQCSSRAIS